MNEKSDASQNVLDLKPNQRKGTRPAHSKIAQFTPNEELLQSTGRIKNQRDIISERMARMADAPARVSASVYEKVKRDYALQLETINELLNEKKQILKDEIRKLYMIREKLTVEVNRHREILEEADFRHYLGEFTQAQYQEVENFETKEIEKAESDLSHINQWIRVHEELFDPQDFGGKPAVPPVKTQETQTVHRPLPQKANSNTAPAAPAKASEPVKTTPVESPNKAEFAHLFDEAGIVEEPVDLSYAADSAPPSLEDLINDVQIATTTPTPAPDAEADYFAQEAVQENSFKIHSSEMHKSENAANPVQAGDSLTLARPAVKQQSPTPAKEEDSISGILDSIRLEGEDEKLSDTNSAIQNPTVVTDYKLKLLEGDLDIREFPLKANTSIGRSPSNDVVLKEPKVSRQHAAINLYNDSYILVDLKSSNGVYVNGTKVDETVLHAGDEISVGGYKFLFVKNN